MANLIDGSQISIRPYSLANRSDATSATANTWKVITTLTAASSHLSIQSKSTAILEIGVGLANAEVKIFELSPGKSVQLRNRDRISVRCSLVTQSYLASEAVYL